MQRKESRALFRMQLDNQLEPITKANRRAGVCPIPGFFPHARSSPWVPGTDLVVLSERSEKRAPRIGAPDDAALPRLYASGTSIQHSAGRKGCI